MLVRSGKSIILNLFAKLARHCVSPLASLCFHSFFLSRCDAIESEGNGTSMKRWKKTPRFRYVIRVYINATFVCIILENWAKVGCSIEKLLNRLIFPLWTSRSRSQMTDRPYRLLGDYKCSAIAILRRP